MADSDRQMTPFEMLSALARMPGAVSDNLTVPRSALRKLLTEYELQREEIRLLRTSKIPVRDV